MTEYQNCVVLFIDILGYKSFESFEEKYRIHRIFHEEIKKNESKGRSDNLSHVTHERRLFSFSDCAYIIYKYKEGIDDSRKDKNKLIEVALFNTSILLSKFFLEGYLIRGGVSYGDAYFDEYGCFGPAVEEAYFLESNKNPDLGIVTQFPRVSLSPSFSAEQLDCEELWGKSIKNKESISYLIKKDVDDVNFLNVFYFLEMEGGISNFGSKELFFEIKSELIRSAEECFVKYKDNTQVSKKISWYLSYLDQLVCRIKNGNLSIIYDVE